MFESVLVANRGEIAVRIMRTLRLMGVRSIAVYTDPDRNAVHPQAADEALCIGGPAAYLDVEAIIAAALASGASALHPGYGFLSENPVLAEACSAAGIVFVGPPASAIRAMGDKINAKQLVSAAGVPVVPGRDGRLLDDDGLAAAALEVGLPVMLKPSAGGGGKGMRRVDAPDALLGAIAAARREAIAAFGDGTLLVERFVSRPRHVEVQVLADAHGHVVALGERECSLQRRHQKIVEESPSPLLNHDTRSAMELAAVSAARSCGYVNAGTVEFIVSSQQPDEFFFMEMNTRLQVEHPVTELVRGVDLVECQMRIAAGEPLRWEDQDSVPQPTGHAIEARVYAEDPDRGFLPAIGKVHAYREPSLPAVRVDSGVAAGVEVGPDYDPMLAKVVAWSSTREEALTTLRAALNDTAIVGVTTNVGYLQRLLAHPAVVSGDLDTGLVERVQDSLSGLPDHQWVAAAAALVDELLHIPRGAGPWEIRDGWRLAGPAPRLSRWVQGDDQIEVFVSGPPTEATVSWTGAGEVPARVRIDGNELLLELSGRLRRVTFATEGDRVWLSEGGESWELRLVRESVGRAGPASTGAGPVTSPMPGTVLAVHVQAGQEVVEGEALVTVEAMKMEHVVAAPLDGIVAKVLAAPGDRVDLGQALVEVSAEDPS
ncbi:MAG TPA: biotin carboxylase N-terminal domain-containing protein [Acidimicrobiales bacterium]|nr:biotin carboxylase N-terminal domain-containing protein [Acidimicrobiales bacterium]